MSDATAFEVTVNGEPRRVPEGATVGTLLESLGLGHDGIAVAVDRRIVPRSALDTTALPAGARIEIIRAVGGG